MNAIYTKFRDIRDSTSNGAMKSDFLKVASLGDAATVIVPINISVTAPPPAAETSQAFAALMADVQADLAERARDRALGMRAQPKCRRHSRALARASTMASVAMVAALAALVSVLDSSNNASARLSDNSAPTQGMLALGVGLSDDAAGNVRLYGPLHRWGPAPSNLAGAFFDKPNTTTARQGLAGDAFDAQAAPQLVSDKPTLLRDGHMGRPNERSSNTGYREPQT
jgi:hypothetical protein